MDSAVAHTLFDLLGGDRFSLVYSGEFPDQHTASLIAIGEGAVSDEGHRSRSHRQRLAFVMVEAYQNIVRHRASLPLQQERNAGRSLFMLRCQAGGDQVSAVDPIAIGEADSLVAMLRRVGGSDQAQLKELFLARLRDSARTLRGGAGLGLIEMARRSGQGLSHALLPLDGEHSLFLLQVQVGLFSDGASTEGLQRIHAHVCALDLVLLWSCGIAPEAQEAVLAMMQREIRSGAASAAVRAYLALLDWLDGHEARRAAVLAIAREAQGFRLMVRVSLPHARLRAMQQELDGLGRLSGHELERCYRDMLLGRSGSGIHGGLLEWAHIAAGGMGASSGEGACGPWLLLSAPLG
jgi:hypothetical protein